MDGNPFYEEIIDAGRLSRLAFKLDFIINEKKEIIQAFAEIRREHKKPSIMRLSLFDHAA